MILRQSPAVMGRKKSRFITMRQDSACCDRYSSKRDQRVNETAVRFNAIRRVIEDTIQTIYFTAYRYYASLALSHCKRRAARHVLTCCLSFLPILFCWWRCAAHVIPPGRLGRAGPPPRRGVRGAQVPQGGHRPHRERRVGVPGLRRVPGTRISPGTSCGRSCTTTRISSP